MTKAVRAHQSEARMRLVAIACLTVSLTMEPGSAQTRLSCAEIEAFMRSAKLTVTKAPSALMDDGTMQHRVFVHTSDESRELVPDRDTWKATVAAYELAKILEINIMPPYVETKVNGQPGSVSWGLENVMMDEGQRTQRNVQPPDLDAWNRQMYVVQVFEELVTNKRAPSDLVITMDWRAWLLAPSQAFRPTKTIQNPGNLVKCDRKLLAKMRTLDSDVLTAKLSRWLTQEEIAALRARAEQIVDFFGREVAAKGEPAVLFDLDRSGSPCAL